ncbi:Protein-disulfide isomerase [Pedococcus dokdonensis]|uniref:Protein-disulfide isomerase n=1 Tax=Pedococcus dokdonensis TaxID=443156 RepID=A0A1H0PD86_9MICO|nr:thioredoxin domain-containing protein [Pedococcus dokdonensis]SDP02720.1 Protein-disulfide isomerase [Pedococcus dokdonensis]
MTSSSASRKAKIQAAAPRGGVRGGSGRGGGGGANRVVVATVVVVVVLAAVVTAVILGSQGKKEATTSGGSNLPKNVAAMGAGIVVNPGAPANVPTLDLYEDFQCPVCARFEEIFGLQIVDMVKANQVKLVAHPLSFLDDNLRNDSSNRAANAAACAADADKFLQYHAATFTGQPKTEGAGYTDAQLQNFATQAGLSGAAMTTWQQCYSAKSHNQWVESVQTQSEKDGVNGTPTVKLNGKAVDLGGLTRDKLAAEVKAATK